MSPRHVPPHYLINRMVFITHKLEPGIGSKLVIDSEKRDLVLSQKIKVIKQLETSNRSAKAHSPTTKLSRSDLISATNALNRAILFT